MGFSLGKDQLGFCRDDFRMQLQPRDIQALDYLARYFMLNSRQLRELAYVADGTGRVVRRRTKLMQQAGLIKQRRLQVVNQRDGMPSPVFHLSKAGCEFLAGHFDDPVYLTKPIEPLTPQHLWHYVRVSDVHILVDRAIEAEPEIHLNKFVHEEAWVNPEEEDHKKRFRLLTHFAGTKKTACSPDAGMVLESQGHRAVMLIEADRDTYFYGQVAARKTPGYQRLLAKRHHRTLFPETTLDHFYVVFFAPTEKRVKQLRDAFAKQNADDPALSIYRFGALESMTPETLLTSPLFHACHHDDLVPLVKKQVAQSQATDEPNSLQRTGAL